MTRLRADLLLLFVAMIWGSAFAVQRVAASYFDVFTFNGLRFLLAGVILLPLAIRVCPNLIKHSSAQRDLPGQDKNANQRSLVYVFLAGILLFVAGGLQQAGLETTTAGNAGFITSLYVVLVPLILWIAWREKAPWTSWTAAGLAVIGSLLLSTGGRLNLARGDSFELGGAVMWALHVILVGKAMKSMHVLVFSAGQYLVAGSMNMLVSFGIHAPLSGMAHAWWTVVYIGVLSTAVGYTLQVLGQKFAPPTDAAILLSTEAVFAVLTGYLWLGEILLPVQILGCILIMGGILLTQVKSHSNALEKKPTRQSA